MMSLNILRCAKSSVHSGGDIIDDEESVQQCWFPIAFVFPVFTEGVQSEGREFLYQGEMILRFLKTTPTFALLPIPLQGD